jgi:RHS repeat-associated protein
MFVLLCVGGAVHATTEWNAQDYDLYSGDFNGDGKTDILYIAKDPSMPSGIALSDGTGPNIAWQSWPSNFLGINWSSNAYNVIVADFNGDGKADILLQSVTPGNSYLLLTSPTGLVVGITQTIANGAMGLTWSADQHHIIAGAFGGLVNGKPKADLFLQATNSAGIDAIVLSDASGTFTSTSPSQTWSDGYLGFKWSTRNANVFAGDFNGDGFADLLIQAKPNFVTINYQVPFPVPTYPPNMNGVVLAQPTAPIFTSAGVQAWSRMSDGVDWSPLTNNIVIGVDGTGQATVILQARNTGNTSYELVGNRSGAIFPSTATALSSNINLSANAYHLIAANFSGGSGVGLYYQSLTSAGTNYVTDAVGATITASAENPTSVTGTVEPTSAGRTAGQFSIAPTGGATYNIPVWTPPGARDIEPHLALHYTSGGPDGVMGPGWALSGISAIARCGKTWASTGGTASTVGTPAGVSLSTTDDLCLDGNRLRLTSGTQGTAGSTYQTELADFSNVTAYGTSGNGPQYFIVQGKDGRSYEYGNTGNSQITASGSTTPYVWAIDKVSDRQSNNMVFTYVPATTSATLSRIQYTATPGTGASYGYQVNFNYAGSRTGGTSLTKYVAGGVVTQAQQLANIQVTSSGTLVRQYNLGYSASPTTNRPMLNSVQECGGSAGTDCIRPTTINYQSGAAGWMTTATASGLSALQYGFLPIDLNGDGIPDALYGKLSGTTITWFARIATATGYGPEIATGATTSATVTTTTLIPGLFAGNGSIQFLVPVSNVWWLYSFVGTATNGSFVSTNTKIPVNGEFAAVDYDGDGLADLASLTTSSTTLSVRRNITKPGGGVSFAQSATLVYTFTGAFASWAYTASGPPLISDFNGDGRADFAFNNTLCHNSGKCGTQTMTVLSNGFGALATGVPVSPTGGINGVPGDWNGDGCTDLIGAGVVFVSNCAGDFSVITVAGATNVGSSMAVDWDGDGQTDMVYTDFSTHQLYLVRSTGNGAAPPVSLGIAAPSTSSFFIVDRNADGQPDIGVIDSTSNSYTLSYYLHNGVNTPPDLATSITDGFGINFSPAYVPINQSSIYIKGTTASLPDEDFQGPLYVVNQFSASDGTGGTYQTTFTYSGARLNLQGRGFEGFATTTSIDSRNSLIHSTAYAQTFPYIGVVIEDDVFQANGTTPISKTSNAYPTLAATTPQCSLCYFVAPTTTSVTRYEVGGTKNGLPIAGASTSYQYDPYGTISVTNSTLTDLDATSPFTGESWNTLITNAITNYPSTWCLGRPATTTSQKTAPGQPALTRTVNHSIDSTNCRATSEIVEPNSALQVTTNFGFDACGNTNSVSVIGLGQNGVAMPARTTTTSYGTRCQAPESVTNALGQTVSTAYNYNLGVKSSATDANGVSVSWVYDDFSRKTMESRSDSTATTWSYTDCVSPSCWGTADLRLQTTETLLSSTGATVRVHEVFSDGLDRLRLDEGNRVLGIWTTQITSYDSLGRKSEVQLPYSSAGNGYHIYAYDAVNRPLTDTLYTSSGSQYRQISIGYLGQTATVTDPKGNIVTKITDVEGKLRQVTDPAEGVHGGAAGTTKYTYDSFDNLVTIVDAIGAKSTYIYNIRGFKTGSSDADTGAWTFTPDSLNELQSQKDANAQVTSFTYDALGRLLTRLEPESTTATTFTYGASATAHNIGQLASVAKPDGYAESYVYDSIGRPQTRVITEDTTNYQFDYAYNTLGALNTLTYPVSTSGVRFALKYLYDSAGYLNEVQDASAGTAFWTLTGANDNSAPTMEVLGNAVSVATGYTPWTGEMITRTEGSAGSTTNLQNLSYTWDLNGNLAQRVDNRQGLTEAFTLDALNRLSTVTLNGVQTLSVQYDQAGDITNKSDVGAYTYGNTAHPHAVTAAGTWTIGYDANGNMNSRAGGAISSYSYNLPDAINYNGSSSQFNYDSSHQRWKQIANYAGTTETTHYIGGLLQVVTRGTNPTEYRHQIPAGSSTAVYTRRTDGTTGTYYATSDHLGSADLVMDSAANVLVRESFTPFGARRGSNWQSTPSTADYSAIQSTTRQGFTGHEMLDAVSLIHMNGRVYDPTLGRFLSADSVIQSLGITQSINPYSYAWNDPLSFTDPSGHSLLGDIIGLIVTVIIAYFAPELLGEAEVSLFGGSFGGLVNAAIAGFIGGFVGGVIATGSLSASLTAGLIAGLTAGLFNEANTLADSGNWDLGELALAHAAVGCVGGQLSSGNCGKGALSAGLAQLAAPYIIKFPSLGQWSSVAQAAEAGLIGGGTTRALGGNFVEGFSAAAAAYELAGSSNTSAGGRSGTANSYGCSADGADVCADSSLNVNPYYPPNPNAPSVQLVYDGVDLSAFATAATRYNMERVLWQFSLSGVLGGAAIYGGVAAARVVAGNARVAVLALQLFSDTTPETMEETFERAALEQFLRNGAAEEAIDAGVEAASDAYAEWDQMIQALFD